MFRITRPRDWARRSLIGCAAALTATLLAACGGGGGGTAGGCSGLDAKRDPNLPGCSAASSVTSGAALSLALFDASGAASTSVAPGQPGVLVATFKDERQAPIAHALVTLSSSDHGAVLDPANGGELTDANGQARVTLAAGTQSGAFSVTASTIVGDKTITASASYTVNLPRLTLGAPVIAPGTLAAGGTASVSVTVLNDGAPYAPAQSIAFSSPCITAGRAKIVSPVSTVNGVASTSYTDLGCASADPVTATLVYLGNSIAASASVNVLPASAGQLSFVSALPQNIALKGTGGAGRQENSTVTFKIMDRNGNPVAGQLVNFSLNSSAGGLSLQPASATTGANGLVSTMVAAGTVNTPVRVSASVPGTGLGTVSDQLVISTGVADQNGFSLAAATRNIEGGQYNGCAAPYGTTITARLADHFHNPVPDGTAISFTAETGSIDASCLTGRSNSTLTDGSVITQQGTPGECTVRYCAGGVRPADGRVTIMAYALGEESFVDANGNNLYDAGEQHTDLGEPFRNDRAITDDNANGRNYNWNGGSAQRASGEQYIDTNGNGGWDQGGDGVYNGVLRTVPAAGVNTVHVRQSLVLVLSNSTPAVTALDPLALSRCVDGSTFVNQVKTVRFLIRDSNGTTFGANSAAGNPLPAGTQVVFSTSNGAILGSASYTVANTSSPDATDWIRSVQLVSDSTQSAGLLCTNQYSSGTLTVTVTTPGGTITSFPFTVTD